MCFCYKTVHCSSFLSVFAFEFFGIQFFFRVASFALVGLFSNGFTTRPCISFFAVPYNLSLLYFTLLFFSFFPSYSFRLFLVSFVSPWHLTNPGTNFQLFPLVALFLLLISLFTSTSLLPWLTAGQNYYRRGQLKPTYFICGRQPIYNRKRKLADSHSTRALCNHQCWT